MIEKLLLHSPSSKAVTREICSWMRVAIKKKDYKDLMVLKPKLCDEIPITGT